VNERERAAVAVEHRGRERADPGALRSLAKGEQERAADPAALPCVDDRDRDLRDVELGAADVPRDADRSARDGRPRDERFAVPVIDIGELVEVVRAQLVLDAKEALVSRGRTEAAEEERERDAVCRSELADQQAVRPGRHLTPPPA
jgi:hypothetical protein